MKKEKDNKLKKILLNLESKWNKFILHPKMNWFRWLIYNFPDLPKDTYRNIKWFIQRGKRGYADCDIWGFDDYLSEIIANGIKSLKNQVHGVPNDIIKKVGESHSSDLKKSIKEWKRILGEIQWMFETSKQISKSNLILVDNEQQREKLENIYYTNKKNSDYRVMTKNECKRYKNGWKLFKKYYFSLWD